MRCRSVIAALALAAMGVLCASESPGAGPQAHDHGPVDLAGGAVPHHAQTFFDIRRTPEMAARRGPAAERVDAARDLEASVPGARVDLDGLLGTPAFVRSTRTLLSAPVEGVFEARSVVREYVLARSGLFGVGPQEIDGAALVRDGLTAHNGVRTLWWQQRIDGIDVYGAQLRGNVARDGRIASVSSHMLGAPAGGWALEPARLSAGEAVVAGAPHAGMALHAAPMQGAASPREGEAVRFEQGPEFRLAPSARRVWFPMGPEDLRPAWRLVLAPAGSPNVYEVIVDARTGALLWRQNLTVSAVEDATYHVWADPLSLRPLDSPAPMSPGTPVPDGTQAAEVAREMITLGALDGAASPDGWISPGGTSTIGNNIDGATDINADNAQDLPRPTDAGRVFDFPIDLSMAPNTHANATVVQMFYVCNWFHDRAWQLGFTEGFANFQADNFGRGGVGGDRVVAQAQDGVGVNNANFGTDIFDGSAALTQMFLFNGPAPDRDGALDTEVLLHEMTHGLSIRLHGGLSTLQAGGMGEGWSDFFAVALLTKPGDDPAGVYHVGSHATYLRFAGYDDNYYFGIRRFPYTTDQFRAPLTFDDARALNVNPVIPRSPFGSADPSAVHNCGEIWCSALLDCRANLMAAHGFAGNELMMRLVVDAMKMSPVSPNFVQARDAILLADIVDSGGENLCALWDGFAGRGLGVGAVADSDAGNSYTFIVESFVTPTDLDLDFSPGGPPLAVDVAGGETFSVRIVQTCGAGVDASSGLVHHRPGGSAGAFTSEPITPGAGPDEFEFSLPAPACGQTVEWYVSVEDDLGAVFTDPPGAPGALHTSVAATSQSQRFDDDFEAALGWQVGQAGDNATTGVWERTDPNPTTAQPDDDASSDGAFCFITGQQILGDSNPGANDVDNGTTTLISPAMDCSGGEAFVTYWRWYSNNLGAAPNTDSMPIWISNDDGASWTLLEDVTENAGAWVRKSFRVSDFLPPTGQVRLRFQARDLGSGSVVEAGVDEVGAIVFPCSTLFADLNEDGVVDTADLGLLLSGFGQSGPGLPADLNGDNTIDTADLGLLIGAFGSGA